MNLSSARRKNLLTLSSPGISILNEGVNRVILDLNICVKMGTYITEKCWGRTVS